MGSEIRLLGPGDEDVLALLREAHRRRGVGRALVDAMREWMAQHDVAEAWVLADNPAAEAFYAACGFVRDEEQPVQMTLSLS